jgi:hypothetical protein
VNALSVLEGLGSILLFLLPGFGLAALLLGPLVRGAVRLACAYLLGLAWVASGLYVLSDVFSVPIRRTTVLLLVLLPALAGIAAAVRRRPSRARVRRRSPIVVVAGVAAIFVSLGVLAEALTNPVTDWDGVMTWATQARFVRAARTVDAPVLSDARFFVSHPRYPLLMPLAQVAALQVWNADDDRLFRPIYAALFPVTLALVFAAAAPLAGRTAAMWAVFAGAVLPVLALDNGGAGGAYSDLPLACFGAAALILLTRRSLSRGEALAAGLLLSGAVLCKTEGFALAFAVLAGAAWARRRTGLQPLVPAALLTLASAAFFLAWRSAIPPRFDENYESVLRDGVAWARAPQKLASAVPVMVHEMRKFPAWGWFFFGVPLVVLAGRNALRRRRVAPFLLAAAGPVGIAFAVYAVHFDPPALAGSTWTRFLIQASIPLAAALASCAREAARPRWLRAPQTTAASS